MDPGLYDKTLELFAKPVLLQIIHLSLDPVPNNDTQTVLLTCRKGICIIPDEISCRPAPGSEVVVVPLDEPNATIDVHVVWRKAEKSSTVLALVDSALHVYSAAPRYCPSARAKPPALNSISQAERRS